MSGNIVKIDILGTSFAVQADESSEYLENVINFYKEKIKSIQIGMSTSDPLKIAILSGILISDEFLKLQANSGIKDSVEIEKLTARIIERIDKSLYNDD